MLKLSAEQQRATNPVDHIWLSASAGTGKTSVLAARLKRLLLRGVKPDAILALTFTKAGAAEMANRVHGDLVKWVRLKSTDLAAELMAIGEDFGPDDVENARTLFAKVLESRGGGLRIMTIHAFCQTLLAGFPLEAGLIPGFRPIEGREEAALGQSVLSELVVKAEREGDARLLGDLSALSRRLGEDATRSFLSRATRAHATLDALPEGLDALVRRAMDVPADFDADHVANACTDGAFDRKALLEVVQMHGEWGTKTGEEAADRISEWLLGTAAQRAAELPQLGLVWATQAGVLRKNGPKHPDYPGLVAELHRWCGDLCALAARAELAREVASALSAGRRYARAYADAKRVRGLVDFDDLIGLTARLLQEPGIGDWIRYKLDQATDHILVDEAQDTNAQQWRVVKSLAGEFFAGEGAKPDALRTMFSVGDYKQSIFGFQGADPNEYNAAGHWFATQAALIGRAMALLSLRRSFRSSQPVLDVADKLLEELGGEALGLPDSPEAHVSANGGFGQVTLLHPITGDSAVDDDGEENWTPDHIRKLAGALASQVKAWLAEPLWLESKNRALRPADVMILVRKRGTLAALIVARLQAEGVPVAGVDRLRLQAPLAVKDLLAAMRFAVQRDDDLTLASLLVSPLMGWDQDALFAVAHGRRGTLWDAIAPGDTRDALVAILNAADRVTPFQFLEQLLSGPLQARKKLVARLGGEVRDPIDELLTAALQAAREGITSLQGFIDWFDRGEGEIVRDAMGSGDAVRVMTVHGAKGLEAPLVILADAAGDPDASGARGLDWLLDGLDTPVPLFRPRSAERALVASLEQAATDADASERREHWRLLYVAMTRAEERLVVAGSLGPRAKGVIPADSWHAAIGRALSGLAAEERTDPVWGQRVDYRSSGGVANRSRTVPIAVAAAEPLTPPPWFNSPAPIEARPVRPLAPSSLGIEDVADPPCGPAMAAAAERGRLLHGLFERLPAIAPAQRRVAGLHWLSTIEDAPELVDAVLHVIENPAFADIFAPAALTEAPLAGVVDSVVISGTVDRLIITDRAVTIVDFKTGRRVPGDVGAIPVHHLRQMAAYAGIVAQIFPGRTVHAALLYSEGPVLHRIDAAALERHKPRLVDAQDNLAPRRQPAG